MKVGKRGFSQVAGVITTLTLIVILFVVMNIANSQGATILSEIQDDQDNDLSNQDCGSINNNSGCTRAGNISYQGLQAMNTMGERSGTLATIIMVAAVITVLLVAFAAFFRGR
jgi:hypothetical protein